MKKVPLKVILFTLLFLISIPSSIAQVYALNQNSTANWLCEECKVINPEKIVDKDFSSYATIVQTATSFGAEIYLNIIFPTQAQAGEVVGVVVEDLDMKSLNATLLGRVYISTFNNNVSNNDIKGADGFNFYPLNESSSKYLLEFTASNALNVVRFSMKGVSEGALDKINIYYAFYGSEPVPVELSHIKATSKESSVQLEWKTASESNNDYFLIERSQNGTEFEEIGIVDGSGNSSNDIHYSFEDNSPIIGTAYYRLKQVDFDQNFKYFDLLSVTFQNKIFLYDVYPNPYTSGKLRMKFPSADKLTVEIRNLEGDLVFIEHSSFDGNAAESTFEVEPQIKPGIYFVILITDVNSQVRKLIVS